MKKALIALGILTSLGLAACAPSDNNEKVDAPGVETGSGIVLEGEVGTGASTDDNSTDASSEKEDASGEENSVEETDEQTKTDDAAGEEKPSEEAEAETEETETSDDVQEEADTKELPKIQ